MDGGRPAPAALSQCLAQRRADTFVRFAEAVTLGVSARLYGILTNGIDYSSSVNLDVLYEDDTFLFVNKPPDIVVQRGYDPDEPVLFEIVTSHLAAKGETAFLMQRLDRGTSGVIFFTKRAEANPRVTRQFEKKLIRKTYLALVHGKIAQRQIVDAPLLRVGPISFGVRDGGKRAVTEFEPLEVAGEATLVKIRLYTGRTHQIRVHSAAIGHALVGDWLYGSRDAARPMLHAWRLEMRHPFTSDPLVVEAPPAGDFVSEGVARGLRCDIASAIDPSQSERKVSGPIDRVT